MFNRKEYMKAYHKKHYSANKEKYTAAAADWKAKNPSRVKEIASKWAKDNYDYIKYKYYERKLLAIDYMGGVCQDCGGKYPSCVYDFHHLDPKEKDKSPSVLLRGSWDKAVKELKKCVLLCVNCHRIRHWGADEIRYPPT